MANWLLDYIEMTEYIPVEFRDQSFLMRELDLHVSNKMSQLELEIKDFFTRFDKLDTQERKDQYDALLKKCDEATKAASDKIKLADRLHELVEKSMRLLDQGLEKLKEDLIEGDKGYIVEDIERRSQELDQQLNADNETLTRRNQPHHRSREGRLSKITHHANNSHRQTSNSSQYHSHDHQNTSANSLHNRSRHNSTGSQQTTNGQRLKKKERKRLNSTMTIFNRNSAIRADDDSTNQTFLSSPSTPDYLIGLPNSSSNSLNDVSAGDNSGLTLKGMIPINRNSTSGTSDKINGADPLMTKARQPVLTAIDAAHAVSPNSSNSDRLILFPGHSNGEKYTNTKHNPEMSHLYTPGNKNTTQTTKSSYANQQASQLSNNLLSTPMGYIASSAGSDRQGSSNSGVLGSRHNSDKKSFATLPLTSRHDPIYMAASQAINATQSMTSGRRTSSLKASYAAINSRPMRSPTTNHSMFDQTALTGEVYCKCRGTKHDPNMIACDNSNCKIEWFHYECVGITTPPDGEWYCDDCKTSSGLKISNNKHLKGAHELIVAAETTAEKTTVSMPSQAPDKVSSLWGR